ncbi:MAG: hypothetical protein JW822_02250 [Spirochaetales bacterium]|nr:hypothetical protein [Spirochaetales bacterium]
MKKRIWFLFILLVVICSYALAQEPGTISPERSEAESKLEVAKKLYAEGNYSACRLFIDETLTKMEENQLDYTPRILASFYILKAFVIYAFREEGYQDRIEKLLLKAIETYIYYEFEDPREVPLYVLEAFRRIKSEYLSRFSKSTRRHTIGIYGGLILLPSVLKDPAVIEPGIHYAFNLSDAWALWLNLAIPTQFPLESLSGSIGVTWFPTFKIETISLGLSMAYALKIEQAENYSHSILFEGYGEVIFRSGFGFGASVELLRFDLFLGPEGMDLPEYGYIDLFPDSSLRLAFANLHFYLFYTF